MFVHISSSWVEICLHTKFQLPGLRRGRLFTWFTWFYRLHPHCYICICYIHLITILHPCIFASLHPCKLTLTWLDSIDCMHLIWPAKLNICIILKCFSIWWFWDMFLGIQDPSFWRVFILLLTNCWFYSLNYNTGFLHTCTAAYLLINICLGFLF